MVEVKVVIWDLFDQENLGPRRSTAHTDSGSQSSGSNKR